VVLGGLVVPADSEAAGNDTLYVNSAAYTVTGETCALGTDTYSTTTANNLCTLRAALTYANAHSTYDQPYLTVTLATGFAQTIPAGTTQLITMTTDASQWMAEGFGSGMAGVSAAYYAITRPMMLDLQDKLGFNFTPGPDRVGIYINAKGDTETPIWLQHVSQLQVNEVSIVVSGISSYVTITDGHTVATSNYYTANFLAIANGASHITLSNYTIGNLWSDDDYVCNSAMICFVTGGLKLATATDILIDNVTFTVSQTTGSCLADNPSGCVANAIVLDTEYDDNPISIDGLVVRNSKFENLWKGGDAPTVFSAGATLANSVRLANFDFDHNWIHNSGSSYTNGYPYQSSVYLPYGTKGVLSGKNYIRNNTFEADSKHPITTAIGYLGPIGSASVPTTASTLYIQDNSFQGYTKETILLRNAGLVTVERNTFGSEVGSQATTADEEKSDTNGGLLMVHNDQYSNLKIATWYPTATAATVDSDCAVALAVTPPTSATAPAPSTVPVTPVRLDVYWNSAANPSKAEVFVASTDATLTKAQTITVTAPDKAIDAGGNVTGYFRLQTQALGTPAYGQLASSQFSRAIPVSGNCKKRNVTGIEPASGPIKGGGTLTITGNGLTDYGKTTGYLAVPYLDFDGLAAINTGVPFTAATQVTTSYTLTDQTQQTIWGTAGVRPASALQSTTGRNPRFYYGAVNDPSQDGAAVALNTPVTVVAGNKVLTVSGASPITIGTTATGNNTPIVAGNSAANATGGFTGWMSQFLIVDGGTGTPLFDGRPAYDPATGRYGLWDTVKSLFFSNVSSTGVISGPTASLAVTLSGVGSGDTLVSQACTNLAIPAPSTLTCTIPPSMLGGDRTGPAQVAVRWTDASGTRTLINVLTYIYTWPTPTLTTYAPAEGGVAGGDHGTCAATGDGFLTYLDGTSFTGTAWVDPGLTLTATSRVVVRFRYADATTAGTVVGGTAGTAQFGFARAGTTWQTTYGTQTAAYGTTDANWHTVDISGTGTTLDNKVVAAGSSLGGAVPYVLGGVMVNGALTSGFVGEIGQVLVYDAATLIHNLVPAAWTVADQTVYGFVDQETGQLWPSAGGGALTGTFDGVPYAVNPTTLTLDGKPVTGVTVTSVTALSCTALPPHAPGTMAAVVTVAGAASAKLAGAHVYLPNGTLQVETLGWSCPGGETKYDDVVARCRPVAAGGVVAGRLTLTYTTTYVQTGPESTGGLTDITVRDNEGQVVCVIADLPLNTPVHCVEAADGTTTGGTTTGG
jgi:hypothetical protein